MKMEVSRSQAQLAIAAAGKAASVIKAALKAQDSARILGATTGNTQLQFHDPQFLDQLRGRNDVDWAKTEVFHLDESAGIPKPQSGNYGDAGRSAASVS